MITFASKDLRPLFKTFRRFLGNEIISNRKISYGINDCDSIDILEQEGSSSILSSEILLDSSTEVRGKTFSECIVLLPALLETRYNLYQKKILRFGRYIFVSLKPLIAISAV